MTPAATLTVALLFAALWIYAERQRTRRERAEGERDDYREALNGVLR